MYVFIYLCIHLYIHTYIHIFIYIHIYIYFYTYIICFCFQDNVLNPMFPLWVNPIESESQREREREREREGERERVGAWGTFIPTTSLDILPQNNLLNSMFHECPCGRPMQYRGAHSYGELTLKGALQLQLTAMVKFALLRYLSEFRLRVLSF